MYVCTVSGLYRDGGELIRRTHYSRNGRRDNRMKDSGWGRRELRHIDSAGPAFGTSVLRSAAADGRAGSEACPVISDASSSGRRTSSEAALAARAGVRVHCYRLPSWDRRAVCGDDDLKGV